MALIDVSIFFLSPSLVKSCLLVVHSILVEFALVFSMCFIHSNVDCWLKIGGSEKVVDSSNCSVTPKSFSRNSLLCDTTRESVPRAVGTGTSFARDDEQNKGTIPMPTFARRPSTMSSLLLVEIPQNSMVGKTVDIGTSIRQIPCTLYILKLEDRIQKPSDCLFGFSIEGCGALCRQEPGICISFGCSHDPDHLPQQQSLLSLLTSFLDTSTNTSGFNSVTMKLVDLEAMSHHVLGQLHVYCLRELLLFLESFVECHPGNVQVNLI